MAWGIFGLGKKERERRDAERYHEQTSGAAAVSIQTMINAAGGVIPYVPPAVYTPAVGQGVAAGLSQQGGWWDRVAAQLSALSTVQQTANDQSAAIQAQQGQAQVQQTTQLQPQSSSSILPILMVAGSALVGLLALAFALTRGRRR
jgi:hypothetical protein